jgi:hypothetical protein
MTTLNYRDPATGAFVEVPIGGGGGGGTPEVHVGPDEPTGTEPLWVVMIPDGPLAITPVDAFAQPTTPWHSGGVVTKTDMWSGTYHADAGSQPAFTGFSPTNIVNASWPLGSRPIGSHIKVKFHLDYTTSRLCVPADNWASKTEAVTLLTVTATAHAVVGTPPLPTAPAGWTFAWSGTSLVATPTDPATSFPLDFEADIEMELVCNAVAQTMTLGVGIGLGMWGEFMGSAAPVMATAIDASVAVTNAEVDGLNNPALLKYRKADGTFDVFPADFIPNGQKGAINGVATLDYQGKVPVAQLPAIPDAGAKVTVGAEPATKKAGDIWVPA